MSRPNCAFCPWDCPSPETQACVTLGTPGNAREEEQARAMEAIPAVLRGVCEPSWARLPAGAGKVLTWPRRPTHNVIRDLADYEEEQ